MNNRLSGTIFSKVFFALTLIYGITIAGCKSQNTSASETTDKAVGGSSTTSPYALTIQQSDNTSIQILGKGNRQNPYTETIDGYTILRNESKIYEYAIPGSNGKLGLSGVKANDPDQRKPEEVQFLKTIETHLRNQ
ncbi:hypothetical protein RT717_12820 [Imperialibacter roseus]|uniref:Lipoprotein n=1 Tax=Imperialibacter roseus TaxID=1324217 RepID=A0ABZ0IYC9_9BACT|nr:hypothetical protein [Imperialibacter roseus]WOK09522.1 hypothetical protein RT717_12820 [Imperialibacter roseus]